jgi:hypothetical protein
MDSIIGIVLVILLAASPSLFIFCVPYGDNVVVYDTIRPYDHHIENGEYHFKGMVSSSHCGTTADRFMGIQFHDFVVDRDRFSNSFGRSFSLQYTCKGGQITDVVWGE